MIGFNFNVNDLSFDTIKNQCIVNNSDTHILTFRNNSLVLEQKDFDFIRKLNSKVNKKFVVRVVGNRLWHQQPSFETYYWLYKNRNLPANTIVDCVYQNPDLKSNSIFIHEKHVKAQIEQLYNFSRLGLIVNGGGFGNEHPSGELIFIGVYDDLLKYLDEIGGGLTLNITTPFPFEVYEYMSDDKIFDVEYVYKHFNKNKQWSTKHLGEYYGKANHWIRRIEKLNLNVPLYINVNFGFTNVLNLIVNKKFDSTYGNWLNYFNTVFNNVDVNIAFLDVIDYLLTNILYSKHIKAVYLPYDFINNSQLLYFKNDLINVFNE